MVHRVEIVGADALARCIEIRTEVFVVGQGVPEALEVDGLDGDATHFLAWPAEPPDAAAVGTMRLRTVEGEAKFERVAVLEAWQGRGVGRALMDAAEREAGRRGLARGRLNAQVAVIPFYEELGWRAEGGVFDDAGIPHRAMRKRIARVPSEG